MGSSSAPISPEETEAMKKANNAAATEMANKPEYYVTGTNNSSHLKYGSSEGDKVNMNAAGDEFRIGDSGDPSSIYKYNEKTGKYHSHGGGIYDIGKAEAQQMAAPSSGGGGGGGGGKPPPERTKPTVPGAHGPADSETILGDTYDHMMEWEPISSDGEGGTQEMNPLVDPNNWFHQVDPKYATPTYSNAPPKIQYGPGGLLAMDYDQENKGLLA